MTDAAVRSLDGVGWVFWHGTLGMDSPIDDRIAAARAGGYTRVSVTAPNVAAAANAGVRPRELARSFHDEGLDVVMDAVMSWHGGSPPPPYDTFTTDDVLRMSEDLGASLISAVGPFPDDAPPWSLAEPFAEFCDRAAGIGARVQLEFMPFGTVTDLATAWDIVHEGGRENGGLIVDSWHFFRGNPDFGTLEHVPGDRIFSIQLSDGGAAVRGTVREDTRHRLLPGDGVFDLERLVATLDRIGALQWVGPEVFSPDHASADPTELGRVTAERIRELVAGVRTGRPA